eukprot:CAMPEP_0198295414 /NCGR_PEP_ID=MMETSP1449-20131203/27507_1 /TAXON_ID=420275 /ORGANISM="Attheya septentrionalis, Strain CCMP2084" /LENGTH=66 /DNA_ID=CAMNT_0043995707 /DNA_START=84 /DNA_END=281 /DNA_ORIENTATION=-
MHRRALFAEDNPPVEEMTSAISAQFPKPNVLMASNNRKSSSAVHRFFTTSSLTTHSSFGSEAEDTA